MELDGRVLFQLTEIGAGAVVGKNLIGSRVIYLVLWLVADSGYNARTTAAQISEQIGVGTSADEM